MGFEWAAPHVREIDPPDFVLSCPLLISSQNRRSVSHPRWPHNRNRRDPLVTSDASLMVHAEAGVLYGISIDRFRPHTDDCRGSDSGHSEFGGHNMRSTRLYISSLFLTAALAAPVAMIAAPAPQEASVQVKVYDKDHNDYHNWDAKENDAWGRYLTENHKSSHEFSKSNKKEQSDYWNWRHSHPD
jgi:hypothetical protein